MGFGITKTTVNRGLTVFQRIFETAMGGFTLTTTGLTLATVLPAGTVMAFNEATRLATVVKTATLQADATNTATAYQVIKGHGLIITDIIAAVKGGKAYAITAIDTTNVAYDVLTVGTTLGVALTAGTGLFQSSAAGATAAAIIATPKGLLVDDTTVAVGADVSVAIRATIYARRAPIAPADVQATLPNIVYSQSF